MRNICQEMGEPVDVHYYKRFTPLEVDEAPLENGYAGRSTSVEVKYVHATRASECNRTAE